MTGPASGDPRRYTSDVDDNARWLGFPYRDGDIVISTRSKSGTTWMQMICALLLFQRPDLLVPDPGRPRPSIHDAVVAWIDRDTTPADDLDSLPGVMWHLTDAWRRRWERNVLLVHNADLSADLAAEMRRIAGRLGHRRPGGPPAGAGRGGDVRFDAGPGHGPGTRSGGS